MDYRCTGLISNAELAKNPHYTEGDELRIRAEIIFTVISGGTRPAVAVRIPAVLLEPGRAAAGPDADEHIMNSSDGYRFRVKKQLVTGIPYSDGIVKVFKNPNEGFTLCQDKETLEFVFDFLKVKRLMSPELSKKIVMAADTFGLKELQIEAMKQLVKDLSLKKAEDVFIFAAGNNIACLRARIFTLIPSLLEKVTGANAAQALTLSVKMEHPALRKKALDVIARDVTEFYLAGGFDEIASVPGLAAEVREAVATSRIAKRNDGGQNEAPAKKSKTTP